MAVFFCASKFCIHFLHIYPDIWKKSIYYKNNINKMKDFFLRYAIIFVQNVDIVCVCICNLMDFARVGGYDIGIFDFC